MRRPRNERRDLSKPFLRLRRGFNSLWENLYQLLRGRRHFHRQQLVAAWPILVRRNGPFFRRHRQLCRRAAKKCLEVMCPPRRICGTVITIVSAWRCKCGVRVMIVAERDLDKPTATVTVACPECGDAPVIDAHRMISITHEKGDDQLSFRASNPG